MSDNTVTNGDAQDREIQDEALEAVAGGALARPLPISPIGCFPKYPIGNDPIILEPMPLPMPIGDVEGLA